MFGYITPDLSRLSEEDRSRFRAYYCGVCRALSRRCGETSRLFLTYDMTFLVLVLHNLYDDETSSGTGRCLPHPFSKRLFHSGRFFDYAADVNVLLAYHKTRDDAADKDTRLPGARSLLLKRAYLAASGRQPDADLAIQRGIQDQLVIERDASCGIDQAAAPTASILAALYTPFKDAFETDLAALGASVGRFIYLMDAYDDLEKDKRSGAFNPLIQLSRKPDLEDYVRELLTLYIADAASAFEALPILHDDDLIRNILYSGVWSRFSYLTGKKHREAVK